MPEQDIEEVWAEPLPGACPPRDATAPPMVDFFRLVSALPVSEGDFLSQRALSPRRRLRNVSECVMRSVSLFCELSAVREIQKFPYFQGKLIIRFRLTPAAGLVSAPSSRSHVSWWRRQGHLPDSPVQEQAAP